MNASTRTGQEKSMDVIFPCLFHVQQTPKGFKFWPQTCKCILLLHLLLSLIFHSFMVSNKIEKTMKLLTLHTHYYNYYYYCIWCFMNNVRYCLSWKIKKRLKVIIIGHVFIIYFIEIVVTVYWRQWSRVNTRYIMVLLSLVMKKLSLLPCHPLLSISIYTSSY